MDYVQLFETSFEISSYKVLMKTLDNEKEWNWKKKKIAKNYNPLILLHI